MHLFRGSALFGWNSRSLAWVCYIVPCVIRDFFEIGSEICWALQISVVAPWWLFFLHQGAGRLIKPKHAKEFDLLDCLSDSNKPSR